MILFLILTFLELCFLFVLMLLVRFIYLRMWYGLAAAVAIVLLSVFKYKSQME